MPFKSLSLLRPPAPGVAVGGREGGRGRLQKVAMSEAATQDGALLTDLLLLPRIHRRRSFRNSLSLPPA